MKSKNGAVVARFGMVGTTSHGEHVGLETQFENGQVLTLLIPMGLYPKLMLGLLSAGAAAHREQLERLGSEQSVIAHTGFTAFMPTGFDLGRGWAPDGSDKVLLRLKQESLTVIDVMLGFEEAALLGGALTAEAAKGPASKPKPQ